MNIQSLATVPSRLLRALPAHLAAIMAQGPPDQAALIAAIAGIRAYQHWPLSPVATPVVAVWRAGTTRLRHYPAAKKRGTIFVVPSLINSAAILDLRPERSFVRWLAAAGYDVLLLDWGRLTDDPGARDLDSVIRERLLPALACAAEHGPVHGLGYCMGGTLLTAAAGLAPGRLRSLTLLASPWDFGAGDPALATIIRAGAAGVAQIGAARGVLPVDWIQNAFAVLNAGRTAAKFAAFGALDSGDPRAAAFVAVEDWLNGGGDLPRGVAENCVFDWYVHNRPARGTWAIGGAAVNPAALRLPVLAVASADDRLVPRESALALAAAIPGSCVIAPAIGHVGMMAGRRAARAVWQPVLAWLQRSD